ncbi:RHS domain-containing protein, partial [bacterium]|nr:RHS domain-containing protein [bacterium]
ISFIYDANGNTTGIGNKTLTYNQNNRLIRVEENSLVLGEYTYNGLGQRVKKTVDGTSTIFHYDFHGKLIAESQADGTMTAEYLYMGKIRIAKVDVTTGNIYYYLNDRLGTPQIMTDDTGTIVWEAAYKPFGEATINFRSSVVNNFRFPGQYYDEETGLHYNYFRYYDPGTGRYLRTDPIGLTGGINLFAYVENNPVNSTDPEGLHGPILFSRWPYWARFPTQRFIPRNLPKQTPVRPKFELTPPRKIIPEPSWLSRFLKQLSELLGGGDAGAIILPMQLPSESDNPCEPKEDSKSWPSTAEEWEECVRMGLCI